MKEIIKGIIIKLFYLYISRKFGVFYDMYFKNTRNSGKSILKYTTIWKTFHNYELFQ